MSNPKAWSTEFVAKGRFGDMIYREGDYEARLSWEVGGTVVFILIVPDVETWNQQYPWAIGRREEISRRLAEAMADRNCSDCYAEYLEDENCYLIKSRRG